MKGIGRIILDSRNDRELNRLARRSQAVDEPLQVVGDQPIQMSQRDGGIWIAYPDGTGAWLNQYVGEYQQGRIHYPGQVVRLGLLTAICVHKTEESPEIIPKGVAFWLSGLGNDDTGFNYSSNTFNLKRRGNEYRLPENEYYRVSKIRFLCPHDQATQSYSIFHERFDTFDNQWDQTQILGKFTSTAKGTWFEFGFTDLWGSHERHRLMLNIISESTPTSFSGTWQQKNENGVPGEGELTFYNSQTRMRIHHTDKDDIDHRTALEAVPEGATIKRGSTEWTLTNIRDHADSYVDWDVSPGGQRGIENEYLYSFEYGSAAPLWHGSVSNHWASNPNIVGVVQNDNDPETENENQFMLDPFVQEVTTSDHWHILSLG